MLLCHWLYQDGPITYKVEILVLTTTQATNAGGFDLEFQYEVRAGIHDPVADTINYRFVYKFPNSAVIRAQVASGNDPLYLACASGEQVASELLKNFPELRAFYDSIILNTATPAAKKAANTPRL